MDLSTGDSGRRHVSVIVSPKSDPNPLTVTTANGDAMLKALTSNPWATALMMQYAAIPPPSFIDSYDQLNQAPSSFRPNKQQQLLPPSQHPQTQPFGALLKAAMRNRNATSKSCNSDSLVTALGADPAASPHKPQMPAVPNRMSYPREFKLLVIGYYFSNGQNKYRTCKEFQITKSMLNGWLQKLEKIQQSRPGSLKAGRSGRKPQFPQVESELYNVYLTYIAQGKKVGNKWLRDTAKCIAQRRCSSDELNGMCQFSERWLCNFKKRFGINLTKDWNEKPTNLDGAIQPDTDNSQSPLLISDNQEGVPSARSDAVPISDIAQSSPDTTVDGEKTTDLTTAQKSTISKPDVHHATAEARHRNGSSNVYEPGKRGRKVQFPQVERALFKKLKDKQTDGARVSNRWLQDEARRLAIELCPQLFTDTFKSARCMFSEHWLHNFKKRYGITLKQPRVEDPSEARISDSALNLTVSEPVSSSDDIQRNLQSQEDHKNQGSERTPPDRKISAGANVIDDLPTMVPLPMMHNLAIPSSINFAEWYSKITTIMGNRSEIE